MTYPISALPLDRQATEPNTLEKTAKLHTLARAFEATMLSEMLQAAGAGQAASFFGGGIGEDQFASFLLRAQAERFAERGGIGLAEMALRAMMSAQAAVISE